MNDDIGNVSSSKSVDTSTVKTYSLSESRDVIVSRHSVIVSDEMSKKFVNLSLQRWAKLRELTTDVDTAVERILKKEEGVFYRRHLGATWFVTIRSGMWCVDIRKYFNCPPAPSRDGDDFLVIHEDSINDAVSTDRLDLKPTRVGLGLRIRE